MSSGSPKLAQRDQAIAAARRRLHRLEIETHRIKAELARLEAEYEDDVADWLTRKLRRRTRTFDVDQEQVDRETVELVPRRTPAVLRFDRGHSIRIARPKKKGRRQESHADESVGEAVPQLVADIQPTAFDQAGRRGRAGLGYRKAASPLLLSGAAHIILLAFCLTATIATIAQQEVDLIAIPNDLHEDVADISEVEIEPTKFEDAELQNVLQENADFNISDQLLKELEPTELGAGSQSLGDIGQLDALPGDLGTLLAGAGKPGAGRSGGPLGEAVFFGARSKGDRFVFVVDNSSSMKGGRLETAIAELLKAIDALSPKQSFYVIFVSDKTYPMFFPVQAPDLVPATAANKKRLTEWLPNAILASGNNRELIKAMDLAASLRPHAVFLLWDGDMKYSDKVRLEVMTHLTRPNQWNFVVNTLGMGTLSLDSQQNLAAIAAAHGGVFQRVDVPAARAR